MYYVGKSWAVYGVIYRVVEEAAFLWDSAF